MCLVKIKFQLKTSKLLTTKGLEISFNVAFVAII